MIWYVNLLMYSDFEVQTIRAEQQLCGSASDGLETPQSFLLGSSLPT